MEAVVKADEASDEWWFGSLQHVKRNPKLPCTQLQKGDLLEFFLVNPLKPRLEQDYLDWLVSKGKLGGNKKALLKYIEGCLERGVLILQMFEPEFRAGSRTPVRWILAGPSFPHPDSTVLELYRDYQFSAAENTRILESLLEYIRDAGSNGVTTTDIGQFLSKHEPKTDTQFLVKSISRYCRELETQGLIRIFSTVEMDGLTIQKRMVYSKLKFMPEIATAGSNKKEFFKRETGTASQMEPDTEPHKGRLYPRSQLKLTSHQQSIEQGFHFCRLTMEANIILNWKSPLANFQKGLTAGELKKWSMLPGHSHSASRESNRLHKKFSQYVKCVPVRAGKAFCLKYYWEVPQFEEHFKIREVEQHYTTTKSSGRDLITVGEPLKKYQRRVEILAHERTAFDKNTYYSTSAIPLTESVHLEMFVVLMNLAQRVVANREGDNIDTEYYKIGQLLEIYGPHMSSQVLETNRQVKDEYIRLHRFCSDFGSRRFVTMQNLYNLVFFLISRNRECQKLEPNCTLNPKDVTKEYTLDFLVRLIFTWTFIRLRIYCSVSQLRRMVNFCLQSQSNSKISYQFALKLCKLLEFLGLVVLARIKLQKKEGNLTNGKMDPPTKLEQVQIMLPQNSVQKASSMIPEYQERFHQRIVIMDKLGGRPGSEPAGVDIAKNVFPEVKYELSAAKPLEHRHLLAELGSMAKHILARLSKLFLPQTLEVQGELKVRLLVGTSRIPTRAGILNLMRVGLASIREEAKKKYYLSKVNREAGMTTFGKETANSVSKINLRSEVSVEVPEACWSRAREQSVLDSILDEELEIKEGSKSISEPERESRAQTHLHGEKSVNQAGSRVGGQKSRVLPEDFSYHPTIQVSLVGLGDETDESSMCPGEILDQKDLQVLTKTEVLAKQTPQIQQLVPPLPPDSLYMSDQYLSRRSLESNGHSIIDRSTPWYRTLLDGSYLIPK